jgi:D-arginine dehydrogenase
MESFDVVIVGAGIAGASLAWQLAQTGGVTGTVLLLERESQPGAHATGRSAAMFMQSYGPPAARALTRASAAFYRQPPAGFADGVPLLGPRGALYVAAPGEQALMDHTEHQLRTTGTAVQRLDAAAVLRLAPCLRPERVAGGLLEPDACDIDVHALHQGFWRGARRAGVALWAEAELAGARHDGRGWSVELADGRRLRAGRLVDAAGAWADEVARRCGLAGLALQPRRRSAFTFDPPAGCGISRWPLVAAMDESWYLKPDAGRLLGSPANADDTVPQDVQPEELDIALGIARIEAATTLTIRRPAATWAGLRTFSPDDELVIGPDPRQPAFVWLAGQGGYGIQSAWGASRLAADGLAGRPLDAALQAAGVQPGRMTPDRFVR